MSEFITIGEPLALFAAEGESEIDKRISEVDHFKKFLAGAEVNVSVGVSRLGHSAQYITKLGEDPFGEFIRRRLNEENVGTDYISSTNKKFTGFQLKSKVSEGDPSIFYFRKNSAAANFSVEDLNKVNLDGVKHVHITGIFPALSESTKEATYKLLELAKERNITTTFDTNLRPQLWNSKEDMISTINDIAFKSDILLPGINEGLVLMGSDKPEEIADFYLNKGVKLVIIKLGSKGAYVKTKDEAYTVEGFKVKHVVDTVGAGDGFAVGVISAILEGISVKEAVRRGNAVGALAVMSEGDNDGYPTHEELEKFLGR
ncbi:2-dehydro-3-deoxygluconokinase [Clostridium acetobutylicum]|uniref:2-keto-3-deoxygluconate kinase (Gene kdgK) n=1 Tax=Clostridium acetobutylicum (strain ATCC 824 / DSM 792 / JCM 1419 / IAM 19013 / LMG 5710 / NBRC 13948 / NRRL B-527 / VKM B-1787 / 2291 / W) TaxID=272562 RepID=Q97M05_CLOAB|nr:MULTISPECIES: sugar kinase [Clostridium]AAK78375.1 2-keto-3-deoxygluconate kinase (gene kdgK) [Clostridium acetobutylicum ATCC 824]ADZ19444.1 2-keto-3-deoxygluconate kinase (gene kdgK) [Clostridium acetobutylicum EA 2018]AEI33286.1 2-keto-3-deoxygluconate kinase, kdgK [Clostridium acetobutylicum DSM 1731]AWV80099.1 sugar kinase [Clostridium acetobutylicum]MBC2392276.1 sugar kinase [Clostridium acetobutylicum]